MWCLLNSVRQQQHWMICQRTSDWNCSRSTALAFFAVTFSKTSADRGQMIVVIDTLLDVLVRQNAKSWPTTHAMDRKFRTSSPAPPCRWRVARRRIDTCFNSWKHCKMCQSAGLSFRYVSQSLKLAFEDCDACSSLWVMKIAIRMNVFVVVIAPLLSCTWRFL